MGSSVDVTQSYTDGYPTTFQYAAGQMRNDDYKIDGNDPDTGLRTEVAKGGGISDGLKIMTNFTDAFGQQVKSSSSSICTLNATINGVLSRYTKNPMLVGTGTQRQPLMEGQALNNNLMLFGYIKPEGRDTDGFMKWTRKPATLSYFCEERQDFLESVDRCHRAFVEGWQRPRGCENPMDVYAKLTLENGDCPTGYYPLYSTATYKDSKCDGLQLAPKDMYCSAVQMCAKCSMGQFSPELNMPCQLCPSGSTTAAQGSYGIRECYCPAGQYVEYWKYSKSALIPPKDPTKSRNMRCQDCPDGGECPPRMYPYAKAGYWQPSPYVDYQTITYKGMTIAVPIDMGPRALYECPLDSCEGGLNSTCKTGYTGHVCGICTSDYKQTVEGCEKCEDGYKNVQFILILVAIFIPILICAIIVAQCISSAKKKLDVILQIKHTFQVLDRKDKGELTGNYLQFLSNLMTVEQHQVVPDQEFEDVTMPEFVALILEDTPAAELTPDEADSALEKCAIWQEAAERGRDLRLQKTIARAVTVAQNLMLQSELNQSLMDSGVAMSEPAADRDPDAVDAQGEDDAEDEDVNEDPELDEEEDDDDDEEEDDDDDDEDDEDEDYADGWDDVGDGMDDMEVDSGASDPMEDAGAQLKILASHFQVLGGFTKSININWPSGLSGLMKLGSVFEFDIFALISIECIATIDLYIELNSWLGIPLAIAISTFVVYQLATRFFSDYISGEELKNLIWSKLMLVIFIIYPSLCNILLAVFKCREIEERWWMTADLSLECYTSDWLDQAMVGIFGILAFPIGIPLWCYTLLSRNRHKLYSNPKFGARYGFFYMRYEEMYWYWEVTEMLRKFILCGVVIFIAQGSMLQLCFSIVTGAFFMAIHFKFQPFEDDLDDNLQTSALVANFLTLVTTILIREQIWIQKYEPDNPDTDSTTTTVFLLLVNLMVMVTAAYAFFMDTLPSMMDEVTEYWDMAQQLKEVLETAQQEHAIAKEAVELAKSAKDAKANKKKAAAADDLDEEAEEPIEDTLEKEEEEEESELDRHIHRLFLRYDLDGSGTINSFDELEQLCCNLGYRLELDLNPTRIDSIIADVKAENPNIEWDLAHFSAWFKTTFIE
jgi:F0F1-type ATP synthase membrane subunit b/b'